MTDRQIVPTSQVLPHKLCILPLLGKPIFPGILIPMMIPLEDDVKIVEKALSGDGFMGLMLTRSEDTERPTSDDLFRIGTAAKIIKKMNLPDGGINIFISTIKRFRIKKFIHKEYPIDVAAEYLEDENVETDEVKALTRSLINEMKQISADNPLFSEEIRLNIVNIDHPGKIADFITSILNIERIEQQKILEILDVYERMMRVLIFINKEKELLSIQKKIQKQINEKISKSQREYFLKEQLKAIKSELGMPVDSKISEFQRFKEGVEKIKL